MLKKIFGFYDGLILYSFFILIFNLLLIQLPLFDTLGYEFAAINGFVFAIVCGLLTIPFLKKVENNYLQFMSYLFLLSFIPLFVSISHSVLTMFCSIYDGLLFYILIVYPAIIVGVGASFLISIYLNKYRRTALLILIFLIVLIPLIEIYFNPQVYFYSPLIGFFPGNIYDEGLSPSWRLFLHQILVFAFFLSIILLIVKRRKFILSYRYIFIIVVLIVTILFQFISSSIGLTTTFSKLNKVLPNKIESERFCLHFDKLNKSEAEFIALSQEYYFEELSKLLDVKPSKKINVYHFNNRQQKQELFGAGNADVAKPWQYAVYISSDSWESSLKHEMVHIFSAEFGTSIFKLAAGFNPAIIEGIAESVDGTYDENSVEDVTSLAFNNDYKINISSLFSGFSFFKSNSALSYTYSGAFFSYLIKKYGINKVKYFYSSGEYENAFNSDLNFDEKEFENSLSSNNVLNNKSAAYYYFGRLSIIQKVCPRFISDRLNIAWQKLNEKDLLSAEQFFIEVNDKSINYSAMLGLSEIYLLRKEQSKAVQLLKNKLRYFKRTPYYYNLIFRIADLYSMNNEIDSAKYYYENIIAEKPNYTLNYLTKTRLSLLNIDELKNYLDGNDSTKYKILLKLNSIEYLYSSIPILLNLIGELKVDYTSSLKIFNKVFLVHDIESSYAAYRLSQFMLENKDYINARKYSALSLRYYNKNPFNFAMNNFFRKTNWFYKYANEVNNKFISTIVE